MRRRSSFTTKEISWVVAFIAVVGAGIFGTVFYLETDLTKATDAFFAAIKTRDYQAASQLLSDEVRGSTPPPDLVAFLDRRALTPFKSAVWTRRQIEGDRGHVEASITTDRGGVVPVALTLVKEHGAWHIDALFTLRPGSRAGHPAPALPTALESMTLVKDAVHQMGLAIDAQDFSALHRYLSRQQQRAVTAQQLTQTFQKFGTARLLALDSLTPVFDRTPVTSSLEELIIKGHYPTQPTRLAFELTFNYEGLGWKLAGITLEVQSATQ